MPRISLRTHLVLLAVASPAAIAASFTEVGQFVMIAFGLSLSACFAVSYATIAILGSLLSLLPCKRARAAKCFRTASRAGLITMGVLYLPLFIFSAALIPKIIGSRAPGGGLALLPLVVGSSCVIPALAGLIAFASNVALLLLDDD